MSLAPGTWALWGRVLARAPRSDMRRSPWRLLLALFGAAAVLLGIPSVASLRASLEPERALYKDFGQDYLLARAVIDGADPYLPIRDLAARYLAPIGYLDKTIPTPHPPSVGILFLPLGLVDYLTAVRIWFGLQLVCLLLGLILTWKAVGLPGLRFAPLVAIALLGWAPALLDLGTGQTTTALLAVLAASELALLRGRATLGGSLLGLALMIKPITWLWLLLLLWRRSWSSLAAALAVGVVCFGLATLRVGFGPVLAYVTQVLPQLSATYANEMTNISLWTVGPRLFQGTVAGSLPRIPPLADAPALASSVGVALPLAVLAAALAWFLRTGPRLGPALGVLTCVSMLVNPLNWQYYAVLLLIPMAYVLNELHGLRFPRWPTMALALVVLSLYFTVEDWRTAADWIGSHVIGSTQLPPLLGLMTLGPAFAMAALGVLLAWLESRRGVPRY